MKRSALFLAVLGLIVFSAGAYAAVQNMAVGSYKNMAGSQFPDTVSGMVTANIIGPNINITKSQINTRTSQGGPSIMVASGDSILYAIEFTNNGSDSAAQLVITDTLAFETIPGQTVQYVSGSASPDVGQSIAGSSVSNLEYFDGNAWNITNSATMPANARGIRWTISTVAIGGPYLINFAVKVTSP